MPINSISTWATSDKISFGSAIIAGLSAVISIISAIYSRKIVKLAEDDFKEKHLPIDLYLVKTNQSKKNGNRFIFFTIDITNQSTSTTSIQKIKLHLYLTDASEILLDPNHTSNSQSQPENHIKLEPKQAIRTNFEFKIPPYIEKNKNIDKYVITGEDSFRNRLSIESNIILPFETEEDDAPDFR
ncbi:hypothetical protein [Chromobacterium violaceum]|uniref:hypothetical protein n=1 Tax=Chromobacterium violaceum TaxID=536 RepID=UPI000B23B372|nr:hypothetical protein [Chromobacterium violaceum]